MQLSSPADMGIQEGTLGELDDVITKATEARGKIITPPQPQR